MNERRWLPNGFPPGLGDAAREFNANEETAFAEPGWQYPTILEVIAWLAERGYAVLGGEVYPDNGRFLGDNWHLNWKGEGAWMSYVTESVAVTLRYVDNYVKRNGDTPWYLPTWIDEEAYIKLLQRKR